MILWLPSEYNTSISEVPDQPTNGEILVIQRQNVPPSITDGEIKYVDSI